MGIRLLSAALVALGLLSQFGCEKREGERSSGTRDATRETARDTRSESRGSESSDQSFVTSAAQANLAEIEAGRLASGRSSNSDVKMFAQHMIDDHTKANKELTELARKKGWTFPERTDDAHQKNLAKLGELSGSEFDRKYSSMMVDDHTKAVALFEEYAVSATDKDLRSFAGKLAPKLRDHLKMARDLSGKVGAPSAD